MEENHHQRKKRKLAQSEEKEKEEEEEEEEEEEDQEEKVEEFFALIRSTREVRNRLLGSTTTSGLVDKDQKDQDSNKLNRNVNIAGKDIGVWNPTFQPEDFLDHDHHQNNNNVGTITAATMTTTTVVPALTDFVLGSTSQLPDVGTSKMDQEEEEEEENEKEDHKGGKDGNNIIDLELTL